MRHTSCIASLVLVSTSMGAAAWAQDRADMERSQIIGTRELPKVLYIVPWKKPVPSALSGRAVTSVLDEALAPIDRDVFRRQIQYDIQTQPAKVAVAPGASTPAGAAPTPVAPKP